MASIHFLGLLTISACDIPVAVPHQVRIMGYTGTSRLSFGLLSVYIASYFSNEFITVLLARFVVCDMIDTKYCI
jgi:hypothetical protein